MWKHKFVFLLLIFASVLHAIPSVYGIEPSLKFSARDQAFLEDLERRSFQYFWDQSNSQTGLVLDRTRSDGSPTDENHRAVASIAATGFGLTPKDAGLIPKRRANACARLCASLPSALSTNTVGFITGWTQRPASENGRAKSHRLIQLY